MAQCDLVGWQDRSKLDFILDRYPKHWPSKTWLIRR